MTELRAKRAPHRLRYAEVLDQCQDLAVIFSNSQLSELFERAGEAFLDFAERSESNSMQGSFFEAMGLIQRRRAEMERIFRREIDQGFERFDHFGTDALETDSNKTTAEETELSLIGHDEMEQHLAAEQIIIKANETFFPELFALSQRLAVVNGGKKLKDYEIPAGPHHLVYAFRRSIEGLEVEVKIQVVLYALFDKFVVKQAKGLYDELNTNLKDAGILPNLKPVPIRSDSSRGNRQSANQQSQTQQDRQAESQAAAGGGGLQDATGPVSLGEELFGSIVDLMSKRHSGTRRGAARRQPIADPAAAAAASRDLVAAVGNVQSSSTLDSAHALVAEAVAIPNLEIDAGFIEKVKEILSQEREQVLSQVDRDKLPAMDSDLIDLIGLLFEYMLNDPILPNLAKALLSHLHTPYLKVALIDRRLLVDSRHPARRLLDQMVEAGSLWIDEKDPQQGIFPALQGIVDRVIKEFSDDVGLFEELLASFEQSMKEHQRKTDTIEQRTQDTALGREKLRLAKRRAHQQIQTLLQRTPLPAPVTGFLSKTWLDQLVFVLLRDKDEERSDAWKQAVMTAEDLITLFEPEALSRGADNEAIADLRKRITESVRRMGSYPRLALESLLKLLDAPDTWEQSRAQAAVTQPERPGTEKTPEEIAAQEDGLTGEAAISEQEKEVIKQLSKMKFGTWFEFTSSTGGAPRRIKLSWLSHLTATCLFVDRSGMQAEIKTLQELAQEILSGNARVIPRPMHPFIERALISIRNMLQGGEETTVSGGSPQL